MNFQVNVEGERTSMHVFRILERRCIAKMGCIRLNDDFSSRSPVRLVYIHTLCRVGHILVRRQGEEDNSVDNELDPAEVASYLRAPPLYVQPQDDGLGMMSDQLSSRDTDDATDTRMLTWGRSCNAHLVTAAKHQRNFA